MIDDAWTETAYRALIDGLEQHLPGLPIDSRRRVLDGAGQALVAQIDRAHDEHAKVLANLAPGADADETMFRIHEIDLQLKQMLDDGMKQLAALAQGL